MFARPDPLEIWTYYTRVVDGLARARRDVETSLLDASSAFAGLRPSELDDAFAELREELDHQVSLSLLACFEGMLRVDYLDRIDRRPKDEASRKFRSLDSTFGDKVPLDEILDVWRENLRVKEAIGVFRQHRHLRDWLAHGRYWTEKSGRDPDPWTIWSETKRFFDEIPGMALDETTPC